ncbi:MAG: hypothetical protein Q7K43_05520 [Candidatus Woesearchaeota archaeon]|nr:hypothetical protein [Candidatus Woesearchaeota archaeon]
MAKRKSKTTERNVVESHKRKRILEENKILKMVFIVALCMVAGFLLFFFISRSFGNFDYRGTSYETVKFCDAGPPCLVTYKTTLPVKVIGNKTYLSQEANKTHDFNFYLRNDPRKLDVNFDGDIAFKKIMVLHPRDDFICDGKGAIAAANLIQLYKLTATEVITDKNATCDPQQRYIFLDIIPTNKTTSINEIYPPCYQININGCEILEGTEKFMIETFVRINEILENQSASS